MDIKSDTYREETRSFIDLRFANGTIDSVMLKEGDVLDIDSLHVTISSPDEFIQHDRGGAGVVGYRKWSMKARVPVSPPGTPLATTP